MSDLLREEIIDAIDEYADLCMEACGEQLFNEQLRKIQLLRDNKKQKLKDLLIVLANQNAQASKPTVTQGDAISAALEWDKKRNFIMPYAVRDPLLAALASEQPIANNFHTVDTERAAMVKQFGDCCMGGDPMCEGGCLVQKAIRKSASQ